MEIARTRFAEEKAKVERVRRAAKANTSGIATMGQLIELYRTKITQKTGIAESTRKRNLECIGFITKTWPGIVTLRPDQVTRTTIEQWRDHSLTNGTGFRPPGAKAISKSVNGSSGSSFNKALDAIRAMLDMAVDSAVIHNNPLQGRHGLKAKVKPKKPDLPEQSKLRDVYREIENSGEIGGWALETADFCRFINYTGCRKSEAGRACWSDFDSSNKLLRVRGTKTEAAFREVPLNTEAIALLERIRQRREAQHARANSDLPFPVNSEILAVKEAQNSLTKACAKAGVPRLTHHDLRDAFATACIEARVDIPTVAGWLGHADGGALLMKTYAHHRRAHSVSQMSKVSTAARPPGTGCCVEPSKAKQQP